jgi:hypothetical protein
VPSAAGLNTGRLRHVVARYPVGPAVLALVVGAMTAAMYASHASGHWWGDDWALYIRQAQSLLDGNPGEVIEQNRFTVETSRGAPFSPPLYPWGFPILLAPALAIVGADVDRLTIVPVLSAAVFACCWYAIARRRIGALPAMVGVVAVTITPLLLGWTELIQSEWPFLAVTGMMLVAIDRALDSGVLIETAGRLVPLLGLGLGAAAAFSVRREGLAMTLAIAAAQLAALIAADVTPWRLDATAARQLAARLLLPHATALASVGVLHVILPSTLVPQYDGTSIANVWHFADRHVKHLAELSGLKRPWDGEPHVLGNETLGWMAVASYLGLALLGGALALGRNRRRDLHLVVYAAFAFAIGGSFPGALNRYVTTVAPILLLLALIGLGSFVQLAARPRLTTVTVTVAVAAIATANLVSAQERIDRAEEFRDAGAIEWGANHPAAVEMFEAVEALTDADAIVAAPKARAMTLETDRLAVQVGDHWPIPQRVDLDLIVVERDADIALQLQGQPDRYELVWQNTRFTIYRPR